MNCKHCGKILEYDPNNDTYAIYNGDIYCDTDCMLFDVDYGGADMSSFSKEDWDSLSYWDHAISDEMSIIKVRDLLVHYNKWRRDNHIPNQYEMPNPTELGKAIDIAIDVLTNLVGVNK